MIISCNLSIESSNVHLIVLIVGLLRGSLKLGPYQENC